MGIIKKIKKSVRKAVRSPSHSKLSSVLSHGVFGKSSGRVARSFGISRKKILKTLGLGVPSSGYNSAAAFQPRRISSLMGGAS